MSQGLRSLLPAWASTHHRKHNDTRQRLSRVQAVCQEAERRMGGKATTRAATTPLLQNRPLQQNRGEAMTPPFAMHFAITWAALAFAFFNITVIQSSCLDVSVAPEIEKAAIRIVQGMPE